MTTNGEKITEDAEMTDCNGDKVVTMMDVLQEQQEFEDDANAVLGASDDKNCTYPKGYIKRQAVYACLTCCEDSKSDPSKRAGVCLACSLTCHENHELVELYTKRNFRCDCGNPKFNSHPCQFTPNKTDFNEDNKYNQNFSGLYCVCHRPYPDPESPEEDEMIQCIICEDWLHSLHLEAKVPGNDEYAEMICKACIEQNEFLHDYSEYAIRADNEEVDVTEIDSEKLHDSEINDVEVKTAGATSELQSADNSIRVEDPEKHSLEKCEINVTDKLEYHSSDDQKQEENKDSTLGDQLIEKDINAESENTENAPAEHITEKDKDIETGANPDESMDSKKIEEEFRKEEEEIVIAEESKLQSENNIMKEHETLTMEENKQNEKSEDTHETNSILSSESKENKRRLSIEDEFAGNNSKKAKLGHCKRPNGTKKLYNGATFWPSNFRQILCTCNECVTMYKDLSLLFLIDPEDTVNAYETLGMDKNDGIPTSQYEKGLQALSSLDRVQQINAMTEYNNMKDKLLDYLKSFKDRKEVVKEEDIKSFFAGMKPKREPDGVYFCR